MLTTLFNLFKSNKSLNPDYVVRVHVWEPSLQDNEIGHTAVEIATNNGRSLGYLSHWPAADGFFGGTGPEALLGVDTPSKLHSKEEDTASYPSSYAANRYICYEHEINTTQAKSAIRFIETMQKQARSGELNYSIKVTQPKPDNGNLPSWGQALLKYLGTRPDLLHDAPILPSEVSIRDDIKPMKKTSSSHCSKSAWYVLDHLKISRPKLSRTPWEITPGEFFRFFQNQSRPEWTLIPANQSLPLDLFNALAVKLNSHQPSQ